MNLRISLLVIISLFLFRPLYAQDTVKHADKTSKHSAKHITKKPVSDSIKKAKSSIKDTTKMHHTTSVKLPKYARDGYVAILGGLGIPNNSFQGNGNATNGKTFSISAAFPGIISHGGFSFKFDHGINGMNETQLLQGLASNSGFSNINCSLAGAIGQYSYSTLLTGLYLTYPSKHFTIDLRVLAGVMFATSPNFSVNYYDQNSGNNGTFTQAQTSGSAFAFDMGIEVRYPVLHKFCVILSADYLTASPSFNYVTTGAGLTSNGTIIQENGRETIAGQSFDLSNFTLGIGYLLSAQKPSIPKIN